MSAGVTLRLARHLLPSPHRSYSTFPRVVVSHLPCLNIPHVAMSEFIWSKINQWPDHTAFECGLTHKRYTYHELRERCRQFSYSLRQLQLKQKSVLGVVMPNTPDYPIAVLGGSEAGLVIAPFDTNFTPHEIALKLVDSNPRALVTVPEIFPKLHIAVTLAEEGGYEPPIYIMAPSTQCCEVPQVTFNLEKMSDCGHCEGGMPPLNINPCSTAAILYSAGTSGHPKGVALSHKNLISNNVQMNDSPEILPYLPTTDLFQEVILSTIPFYNIFGFQTAMLGRIYTGNKVVTLPKFITSDVLRCIDDFKVTNMMVVPKLLSVLDSNKNFTPDTFKSIRSILSLTSPIKEDKVMCLLQELQLPIKFLQGYGMTETCGVITVTNICNRILSSVGHLVPNTKVKVIDVKSKEMLGPCQEGEICIQGPQVMVGYSNDPVKTTAAVDSLGWLHTADVGYYDKKGNFYITDRAKVTTKASEVRVPPLTKRRSRAEDVVPS